MGDTQQFATVNPWQPLDHIVVAAANGIQVVFQDQPECASWNDPILNPSLHSFPVSLRQRGIVHVDAIHFRCRWCHKSS
jgi:hypothetical protein